MKVLRATLSTVTLLLLGLGYAGSQISALGGDVETRAWAARVDTRPVASLALVLLALAIVLSLVREREKLD